MTTPRTQPHDVEVPDGTDEGLARQLRAIQANFEAIFADLRTTSDDDPNPHAESHEDGGDDEISVEGLSGELADPQEPKAHGSSHHSGGADAIKLDDLATPDDNTDLDASASRHGLLPKLSGDAGDVLLGDGTWGTLTGGRVPLTDGDLNETELIFAGGEVVMVEDV